MSETPPSFWSKPMAFPRWLKIWLVSVLIFFLLIVLVSLVAGQFIVNWGNNIANLLVYFVASGVLALGVLLVRWLCCWRNLRRTLFALACVVTVAALFYAEEDWRGKHAWDQFRHEWEARGEHFKLTEIAPPPVPDDQNFALTPLVFSSYGQMEDRTGHEIRPRNTNLVNRLEMEIFDYNVGPVPTKATGDWSQGTRADLSELQAYYRMVAAKTNLFPIPSQPQSPADDVLLALSRFNPTIEELRQDASLPFSRFPLEYDKDYPAAILLPHLAYLKKSAEVLQLRALAELQKGQTDAALADVQLTLRLVDSIRTEPILISQLVRVAMLQLILQPVWEGLATHAWSESQLEALNAGLAKLDFVTDYRLAMRGEMALAIGCADYIEQNSARYNDAEGFSEELPPDNYKESMRLMIVLMNLHMVPSGWFDRSRLFCAKIAEDNYLPAADVAKHTFIPALAMQGDAVATNDWRQSRPDRILADLSYPGLGRATEKFALGQSSADRARVAVALERYRLVQGHYPDSLAALSPQFLDQIPVDVIGGQPLHYRRTADGQFILYSIGWNETDDGGVRGPTPFTGDWVWSY